VILQQLSFIYKEKKTRRRVQKITKIIYKYKKGREGVEIKEVCLSKTYNSNDDKALHVYDCDARAF
jgi:hypothetical protein